MTHNSRRLVMRRGASHDWAISPTMAARLFTLATFLRLASSGTPWQLGSYELCNRERLGGINNEASGVTYSRETDSLWVITRNPPGAFEYSVRGDRLSYVKYSGARDPEGIAWMYFYTFAIAGEVGPVVSIVNLWPWKDAAEELHKIDLSRVIDVGRNKGLEGITYDSERECLYATQEQDPKTVWRIYLTGRAEAIQAAAPRRLRDLAGAYYPVGANHLMILSQQTKKVVKTDFDGNISEERTVSEATQPEGLTFTPDGALMIVVGEPNEMFVYTSTDECDYAHPPGRVPGRLTNQQPSPVLPPGYCNFNVINICDGVRHGTDWCNYSPERCDRCGGRFCWADGSGFWVPPSEQAAAPPTPSQPISAPEPTTATPVSDSLSPAAAKPAQPGYCNYNNINICDGVRHGSGWCNSGPEMCDRCGGRFCWADGSGYWVVAPTITPAPAVTVVSATATPSAITPTPGAPPTPPMPPPPDPPLQYYELPRHTVNPQLLCTYREEQLSTESLQLLGNVQLTLRLGFLVDPSLVPRRLADALPAVLAEVAFRERGMSRSFGVADIGQPAVAEVLATWAPFDGQLAAIQATVLVSGSSRAVAELVEEQLRFATYTSLLPQALSRALRSDTTAMGSSAVKAAAFVSGASVAYKPGTVRVIAWDATDLDVRGCDTVELQAALSAGVVVALGAAAVLGAVTIVLTLVVLVSRCRAQRRSLLSTSALDEFSPPGQDYVAAEGLVLQTVDIASVNVACDHKKGWRVAELSRSEASDAALSIHRSEGSTSTSATGTSYSVSSESTAPPLA